MFAELDDILEEEKDDDNFVCFEIVESHRWYNSIYEVGEPH